MHFQFEYKFNHQKYGMEMVAHYHQWSVLYLWNTFWQAVATETYKLTIGSDNIIQYISDILDFWLPWPAQL
jgi:hypothetical protein